MPSELALLLAREEDTAELGKALARVLAREPAPLFLFGPLGAGKTTLARALVAALPGGEQAEAGSPSFNLVNHYPTRPAVAHFDLYRLPDGADPGDEYCDCLDDETAIAVVEWSERLKVLPDRRLELRLEPLAEGGRRARLRALGPGAEHFTESLALAMQPELQTPATRDRT